MTAIAGVVGWADAITDDGSITAMLEASAVFGPVRQSSRRVGRAWFGHALTIDLPQDRNDGQPLVDADASAMIVVDGRIDNRGELIADLDLDPAAGAALSDAALFAAAWDQWGEGALDRLLGDIAFARWDADRSELVLGRTPATSRSLFYHLGSDFAAFASMPAALHRLDAVPKQLNLDEVARRLSGGAYFGTPESAFATIASVEPGTIVRIRAEGHDISRFWDPSTIAIVRRTADEAAAGLRAEFVRSVGAVLRRDHGSVASHLSGGRDSGAVTATAAKVLGSQGEGLTALTAAPRVGFPRSHGRYALDESGLAADVASAFPNIRHVISRSAPAALCELLDSASRLHSAPMGSPANIAYWTRLVEEARDAGAAVLLTGANGNFSISLGGLGALSDVLSENGVRGWWSVARAISGTPWRAILNQSFGRHLPRRLHRLIQHRLSGAPAHADFPLFTPALRDRLRRAATQADTRPPTSYRATVRQIYRQIEYADKIDLALCGIDSRDPTADRRLIEFCLSLPADQIVGSQGQRPIYDLAFADLVAASVRTSPRKGMQGGDWFEIYDPEEIRAGFRRYSANRLVRELIDIERVFPLLDAWPTVSGYRRASYDLYPNHVMLALSLASFVDVHFPELRDR